MNGDVPNLHLPPPTPSYVDEVHLVVKFLTSPDKHPNSVTGGIVCDDVEIGVSHDQARHFAKAAAWDEDRQLFVPHILTEEKTEYEWGASASAITWILEVASDIGPEALYPAIIYSLGKIRGKRAAGPSEPLTFEIAESKARQAIGRVFGVEGSDLTRVGEGRDSSSDVVHIRFVDSAENVYVCEVRRVGGLYLTTRVDRNL